MVHSEMGEDYLWFVTIHIVADFSTLRLLDIRYLSYLFKYIKTDSGKTDAG